MTDAALDPVDPPATTRQGRGRTILIAVLAIVFAVSAIVGAYLDWLWWPVAYGGGLLIALGAGICLLVGGIVSGIGRGVVRRIGLVVLAVGVGLVAGQLLGPSREPVIFQGGGTMTLHLTSPVVAEANGPVDCQNVASGTEFSVDGDPNLRLDTPEQPFVSIAINVGDRWKVLRDIPRKDGVSLQIGVTGALVQDGAKPGTVGMDATDASTLTSAFSNAGGSITFADLEPQVGPDFTGDAMDLAGTVEWTCGAAPL